MKKNILTLMFVLAFVCGGVSVVSAKSPSPSNNPYQKLSKKEVQAKLKQINVFVNQAKLVCKTEDSGCALRLADLITTANSAIYWCGADGSNYNSVSCTIALLIAEISAWRFTSSGCEVPGDFQVTENRRKTTLSDFNRKKMLIRESGS